MTKSYDPNAGEFGTFYFAEDCPEIPTTAAVIVCPCDYYTAVRPLTPDALRIVSAFADEPQTMTELEPDEKPSKVLYALRYVVMAFCAVSAFFTLGYEEDLATMATFAAISIVLSATLLYLDKYIAKHDSEYEPIFY